METAAPPARSTKQESFMNKRWIAPIAAALIGTGFLAATAFAYGGGGGHGRHHGDSAMGLCIGVMSPTQKAALRSTLGSSWTTLKTDSQAVRSAKAAITHDILYGNSVTTDEAALATAESTLQSAKDSLAAQVCSNVTNIGAVQTLYGQLQALHPEEQTLHQDAHSDFQAARAAQSGSGGGTVSDLKGTSSAQ
jgi:hypothetical protein